MDDKAITNRAVVKNKPAKPNKIKPEQIFLTYPLNYYLNLAHDQRMWERNSTNEVPLLQNPYSW